MLQRLEKRENSEKTKETDKTGFKIPFSYFPNPDKSYVRKITTHTHK